MSFNIFGEDVPQHKELFNMSLEELLNLKVISSSNISQKFSFAPSVITVITKEQIEHFGYKNIAECISSIAGIDILFNYNQYDVGIRGITSDMMELSRIFKLMINDVVVSFDSKGSDFLGNDFIPISSIERIEIIRGPNSVNYGANAYLGVINVITKKDYNSNKSLVKFETNLYNENFGYGFEFYKTGNVLNFDYIVSADYDNINFYGIKAKDLMTDELRSTSDNKHISGSFFSKIIKKNILGKDEMSLQFIYQNHLANINFVDFNLFSNKAQEHLDSYNINLQYNRKFYNRLKFQSSFNFSSGNPLNDDKFYIKSDRMNNAYYKRDFGYKSFKINTRIIFDYNYKLSMSLVMDNRFDDFDLLNYSFVTNTDMNSISNLPFDTKRFNNTGISYQFNYKLLKDRINFNAGIRYDINSVYGNNFNYRVGLSNKIFSNIYVKLLFGTSYKPPDIIELYSNLIREGGILSNADLTPQRSKIYEISLIRNIKNKFLISFNLYDTKIFDHIIYKKMVATTNLYPLNQSKIVSKGLEFEILYNIDNINLYLNYSFVDSKYSKGLFDFLGRKKKAIFRMNLYPEQMLKCGITKKFDFFIKNISLEGKYFTNRIGSRSNIIILDMKNPFYTYKLDDYILLNFFLRSKDITISSDISMNIFVKIYNLMDVEFYYPGTAGYDIGGFGRYFRFGFKFYLN